MLSAATSGSNQLPAPIFVAPDQTTAEAAVGETIVFDQPDPANTTISTDKPDVLQPHPGHRRRQRGLQPGRRRTSPRCRRGDDHGRRRNDHAGDGDRSLARTIKSCPLHPTETVVLVEPRRRFGQRADSRSSKNPSLTSSH